MYWRPLKYHHKSPPRQWSGQGEMVFVDRDLSRLTASLGSQYLAAGPWLFQSSDIMAGCPMRLVLGRVLVMKSARMTETKHLSWGRMGTRNRWNYKTEAEGLECPPFGQLMFKGHKWIPKGAGGMTRSYCINGWWKKLPQLVSLFP